MLRRVRMRRRDDGSDDSVLFSLVRAPILSAKHLTFVAERPNLRA